MSNQRFDERQQYTNYKLSHHALIIVFALLIINGLFKSNFNVQWAEPMSEMIVLIVIPGIYYITRAIVSDSYVGLHENLKTNVFVFLFLGALFTAIFINSEGALLENGLSDNAVPLIAGIYFIYIGALHVIKYTLIDNK